MDVSIVVPLFNEEESVGPLHARMDESCSDLPGDVEVIYVDDGSSDATWARLAELRSDSLTVVLIRLRENSGQTPAMAAGFEAARGRYVVSMDGDLQNDPADIGMMVEAAQGGYELVCGWRKNRQDRLWSRKIPSRCANWLIRRITGVHIHDYGCSLKVYHRSLVKQMRLYSDMHRFLPFIAQQFGARVGERVVRHHARRFGESKYGIGRTWKVLLDLVGLKLLVHYVRAPIIMFAALAAPFLVGGTVIGIAAAMSESLQGPVLFGCSFLLIGVALIVGAVGLLGQAVMERDAQGLSLLRIPNSEIAETPA